jgi:hypothetical protein
MGVLVQVTTCRKRYKAGEWKSITARSGLTNPLHTRKDGLDMPIQAKQGRLS